MFAAEEPDDEDEDDDDEEERDAGEHLSLLVPGGADLPKFSARGKNFNKDYYFESSS